MLQWGHDLSAVETRSTSGIGPKPSTGFNGATTFQPWKPTELGDCRAAFEFSTGFNGATTFQPWKPGVGKTSLALTAELQWGHDLSAVETALTAFLDYGGLDASMGPRPFSRGNPGLNKAGKPIAKLQWGHDLSAVETREPARRTDCHSHRFNGATTFQPWKRESW